MKILVVLLLNFVIIVSCKKLLDNQKFLAVEKEEYNWRLFTSPQINGLNHSTFTTGPIVIVDRKTLFIPNIQFNAKNLHYRFFMGYNTTEELTISYLSDENAQNTSLHSYTGTNIYLHITNNWIFKTNKFFGVWDMDKNAVVTSVPVAIDQDMPSSLIKIPEHNVYFAYRHPIVRLPKCCPLNAGIAPGRCDPITKRITFNFSIYNDKSGNRKNLQIIPYYYQHTCTKLPVDNSNIQIIVSNSTIFRADEGKVNHHGEFCIDTTEDSDVMRVFACVQNEKAPNYLLGTTIASVICYAFTGIWYFFILYVKDIYKLCFVIYCVTMAAYYLSIILFQIFFKFCVYTGSVLVFLTMFSYMTLLTLFFELYLTIRTFGSQRQFPTRLYYYLLICFLTSSLITITSLYDGMPDVPHAFIIHNIDYACDFNSTTNYFLFYVPIFIVVVLCGWLFMLIKHNINAMDIGKNCYNDDWCDTRDGCRFRLRSYFFFLLIMSLYLIDIFLMPEGMVVALDYTKALGGVLTMIIFVFNKYGIKETSFSPNKKTLDEMIHIVPSMMVETKLQPER